MIVRRHGHHSPHTLTVLSGDFTCGDEHCGVGTHIELPFGAAFGPFVAGPDGVELYEVMMGDPRSWSDEPEVMHQLLAGARGGSSSRIRRSSCPGASRTFERSSAPVPPGTDVGTRRAQIRHRAAGPSAPAMQGAGDDGPRHHCDYFFLPFLPFFFLSFFFFFAMRCPLLQGRRRVPSKGDRPLDVACRRDRIAAGDSSPRSATCARGRLLERIRSETAAEHAFDAIARSPRAVSPRSDPRATRGSEIGLRQPLGNTCVLVPQRAADVGK